MRALTVLVLLGALLWGGWWVIGSEGQKQAITSWFDGRNAAGWTANLGTVEVAGFPNRFDTGISDVYLLHGEWGWQTERLTLLALSYQPNHIIVDWPASQRIETPAGVFLLSATELRASLEVAAENRLPLQEFRLSGEGLQISAEKSPELMANTLLIVLAATEDPLRYRGYIGLKDVTSSGANPVVAQNAPIAFEADGWVLFEQAPDRHLIDSPPQTIVVELDKVLLSDGKGEITAHGEIEIDPTGIPTGNLSVSSQEWEYLLDLAKDKEWIDTELASRLDRYLDATNIADSDLAIPLSLRQGGIYIGPIRIADLAAAGL